jgi:hypothetical protein
MEDEPSRRVDVLPGLIWKASPDERLELVNPRFGEHAGFEVGETVGFCWRLDWDVVTFSEEVLRIFEFDPGRSS